MKPFDAFFPVKIVMGAGRINEIGKLTAQLGKKAFGVFDPFLKDGELIKQVRGYLKENGVELVEFYKIVPNPRYTDMDEGMELCKKEKCDSVVTIGGGSAIDTAKAIAIAVVHGGSTWDYTERYFEADKVKRPKTKGLPLIAVPTTSGTGAEATLCAVVDEPVRKLKCAIINPAVYPDIALLDPELTYSAPPMLTALTGLDTFAHAFESYLAKAATEFSEMLSLKSIELFIRSIRTAVKEPRNADARADMALASCLAGASFCQASLCLPHAIGQPVSAITDAPHGGSLAVCIPPIIEWTLPFAQEKIAKVAEMFDPSIAGLPVSEKARKIVPIIKKLYEDLNVKVSYKDYGMTEKDVVTCTDLVFAHFQWDIKGHPKEVTREDVMDIYRKCL